MNGTPSEPESKVQRIAIIVAAGKGERAGTDIPKQFANYDGKPLLMHSIEAFLDWPLCDGIFVAIGADQFAMAEAVTGGLTNVNLVAGGASRRESVQKALEAINASTGADSSQTRTFIHDAARPGLRVAVLDRLDTALNTAPGAIPALPIVDSLCRGQDHVDAHIDRDGLWRIQTPQAFHFDAILNAHHKWDPEKEATDDAMMLRARGGQVQIIRGDEALHKITYASDFSKTNAAATPLRVQRIFRTGMGYDVHRLVSDEELWLCGIKLDHHKGLAGHSDADVALHALTDALLGALALGDIGDHFPPSDPQWSGAKSDQFLRYAAGLAREKGGEIVNVDLTIICEAPKIGPYRQQMRQSVADMLDLSVECVSVKATTTERLGFTGREEGIAAQAIATVAIPDHQE
jgi:2-C-methyl-D-erythritol 4-phosphate cytidylyltransferase/2-C-methyl-D-erythritol 2,4-cyclodiphosphate synthase